MLLISLHRCKSSEKEARTYLSRGLMADLEATMALHSATRPISFTYSDPIRYVGDTVAQSNVKLNSSFKALGHNSVVFMIECQVNFVTSAIDEMMKRDAQVISLTKDAEDQFMDKLDDGMKDSVWARGSCGSFYVNPKGDVVVVWPNSTVSYWWQLRNTNWSNFEFL